MYVCVCVCEIERERERERVVDKSIIFFSWSLEGHVDVAAPIDWFMRATEQGPVISRRG